MNAERLGLIIKAVREDMSQTGVVGHLQALTKALDNQINTPNAEHQKQVSDARNKLFASIQGSKFSELPRTWRNTLEELGIYELLGEQLQRTVHEIFERNQITPDIARNEIQSIHKSLTQFDSAFAQILQGFEFLKIESEGPDEGEAELSILMPTEAFGGELKGFAQDIQFFDQAVRYFSEIKTGSRETPHLTQLSSSDPTVLVSLGIPALGVMGDR